MPGADRVLGAPPFDLVEYLLHGDPGHPVVPVLHRERIVLARVAICVDHEVAELPVGADALGVRVAYKAHYRPIERDGHVEGPCVGSEDECCAVNDPDEPAQSALAERTVGFRTCPRKNHPLSVHFA